MSQISSTYCMIFASYSDDEILGTEKLKVMLYLLKYIWSSNFEEKLGEFLGLLRHMPDSEMQYLVTITMYVLSATKIPSLRFVEIVEKNVSRKGGDIAMTTAEQLICQGKKEGKRDGKLEVARKMLAKGMAISEIVEITGLSVDEIQTGKISEDT